MPAVLYRYGAWLGPAFIVILIVAFLIMGFLPPVPPSMGGDDVAAYYQQHRTGILVGGTLALQFSSLMFFWLMAISAQIRRIHAAQTQFLADLQAAFGFVGILLLYPMAFAWLVAAFRADRSPEIVGLLNDIGWLILLTPVLQFACQCLVIGSAILADQRSTPLFPRWAAYLNFWVGLLLAPGAAAPFFKTGPFAWNGLFVFWIPLVAFIAWIFVMAWLVAKAAQISDEQSFVEQASGA